MARAKKKNGQAVATDAWMVSFASLATVLLGMFIVLSTLGKDQTGISTLRGLGSFREYRAQFGFGGLFDHSGRAKQFEAVGPRYVIDELDQETELSDKNAATRSIDGEREKLQRFLDELDRLFPVETLPPISGQAVVDFHQPFPKKAPLLSAKANGLLTQIAPLLRRSDYQVAVVVWATMPSQSAWVQATNQATALAEEIATFGQLNEQERSRLVPHGQPWPHVKYLRPIWSLQIMRIGKDQRTRWERRADQKPKP